MAARGMRYVQPFALVLENSCRPINQNAETGMKILSTLVVAASLLAGCISSNNPPPPAKTTVIVPPNSTTTVVCQDGSKPPC